MRPAVAALVSLLGAGCEPAANEEEAYAVVMAVGSLDAVANIQPWVLDIDDPTGQTWRDEPFDVPRSNFVTGEPTFEPLRVRVDLEAAGRYVIRLVGRGGAGMLEYTGCYEVNDLVEDDFVLLGRLAENDADFDSFPDDADAYCAMLRAAGAPCPTAEDLGTCPPIFAIDCDPEDASVYPLAIDVCENGVDEDCHGGDAPCGAGCDPPCSGDERCVGGECT